MNNYLVEKHPFHIVVFRILTKSNVKTSCFIPYQGNEHWIPDSIREEAAIVYSNQMNQPF